MPEEEQRERREQSQRELDEHDRIMTRSAAHAARDTLHDVSAGQKPGAYTTYEARDRAAHTPSILERDGPRNHEEEAQMIDALHKELFPTEKEWQAYRQDESAAPRAQTVEHQQQGLQAERFAEKPEKEKTTMTPEQQANIDKVLDRGNMTDKIGAASDVNNKPTPNDPTPMDKSRDIGQDLQKQGVTMDKD